MRGLELLQLTVLPHAGELSPCTTGRTITGEYPGQQIMAGFETSETESNIVLGAPYGVEATHFEKVTKGSKALLVLSLVQSKMAILSPEID
jgi:hypothetical protein